MHGDLLADIGKAVLAAGMIGLPAYFLRVPLILAYLLAGVFIGPHLGLGLIQDSSSISNLSEIGLVLLLFILGLEINLQKLLQSRKAVFISGFVQILGGIFLAALFFYLLGYGNQDNYTLTYLAVTCALSSTLIVVKILSDQMYLDSLPSRITLGILVLQDLFAIGFLALQSNLTDLSLLALFVSFLKVGGLVLFSWVLARFVLPPVFKRASLQPELMLVLAMAWCFALCGIADYLGLSLEMGALVAGVSIASFPYHLDVAAKISSLRDFFITLFFVSLGLQIPMPTVEVMKISFFIIIFVLSSRLITVYPVLHLLGYANRASLLPAINLSQFSELSLVLVTLGVGAGHVGVELLSAFIIAMVVTALISSFLIPSAHHIYIMFNPFLQKLGFLDQPSTQEKKQNSTGPALVILGFYKEASSLLYVMQTQYSKDFLEKILIVDLNPEVQHELRKLGIQCQYGDVSNVDTLRNLNLKNVKIIFCSIPDKALRGVTNLKLLKSLQQITPESCFIMTADNIEAARQLYQEGASYVFLSRIIGATYLADVIEHLQINGPQYIREKAIEFLRERKEIVT